MQLTYFARNRCASVRSELAEDASVMSRRRLPEFEEYVGRRVGEAIAEVHEGIGTQLADLATESGLTPAPGEAAPAARPVGSPPLTAGGLERN